MKAVIKQTYLIKRDIFVVNCINEPAFNGLLCVCLTEEFEVFVRVNQQNLMTHISMPSAFKAISYYDFLQSESLLIKTLIWGPFQNSINFH